MLKHSKGLVSALAFILIFGWCGGLSAQIDLVSPDVSVFEGNREVEVFWSDHDPELLTYVHQPVLGTVAFHWKGHAGVSSGGFYLGACDWTNNVVVSLVAGNWELSWREIINWKTMAQRNMRLVISDLETYYDLSDGTKVKIGSAGLFAPDMAGWSGPQPAFGGIYQGGQSYPDSAIVFTFTCSAGGELGTPGTVIGFSWESRQRRPVGVGDQVESGSFTVSQAASPVTVQKGLKLTLPAGSYAQGESFAVSVRVPLVNGDRFSVVAETFDGYLVLRHSIEDRPGEYKVIANISKCDSFEFFENDQGLPDPSGQRYFIDLGITVSQPGVTDNPEEPTVLNGFPYQYAVVTHDMSESHEDVLSPIEWHLVYPSVPPSTSTAHVYVVPNPYVRHAGWEMDEAKLRFVNVPEGTVIRIYDASGGYVNTLYPDKYSYDSSLQQGSVDWDLKNGDGTKVISGIYIYKLESKYGDKTGRFIIVR
jgi:hypothetical protein